MKFNKNRSKGSGNMELTRKCYGRNDGQTDEGHSYNPHPLRGGRLKMEILLFPVYKHYVLPILYFVSIF